MGLHILDECSKHGVFVLKVCGYRSPLHRGWSGGCASRLQSGKDLRRWMLGVSCCSILSRSSGSQHAKKQILEVYRPLLIFLGEYPPLYDYWIGVLKIWTLTPIGRSWQIHGKVWGFVRIKLVYPVFYQGKRTHSEIIHWSTNENQGDARIKIIEGLIVETICKSGNLISNVI